MSRFKTATIDENNTGSWVERRRKGRMIRKQHTVTGAWTGWERDPNVTMVEAENTAKPNYQRMTVAELFPLARSRFGMLVTTKTRKAELVRMLTGSDSKGF